jgi:hypothetical protein
LAAQPDFKTIQQNFENQSAPGQTQAPQSHHHHHGVGSSEIGQLLDQLGTALQAGDLSTAQPAYTSLTQPFRQSSQSSRVQTESTSGVWFEQCCDRRFGRRLDQRLIARHFNDWLGLFTLAHPMQ